MSGKTDGRSVLNQEKGIVMQEKRKMPRIKEENAITMIIISDRKNFSRIQNGRTKDISASGVRIQTETLLPVDALLSIDLTLTKLEQRINAIGKVRWVRKINEDETYEAGVEFINAPVFGIQQVRHYVRQRVSGDA